MPTNPNIDAREGVLADVVATLEAEIRELRASLAEARFERRLALEEAERRSLIDTLTGLHNRQGFFVLAEQQLRGLKRSTDFGALVVADIDGLRACNEAKGPDAGDRLVFEAATALRSATRAADVVGRLGGDEFGVFLPCDDPAVPELVVARIEQAAAAAGVSFTVGVATGEPAERASLEDLLATADAAMFRAKALRRQAGATSR